MADDYTAVIKAAKAQGIRVEHTARHRVFIAPNGNRMVFPTSGSDSRRGVKNLVADLRNGAGFIWPPPSKKELRARRNREEGTDTGAAS